jgi:hypothetical protein
MIEPWNLKKEDTRLANSLPNFIIFCEDEVSEPIYLKSFETSRIKVNTIKKQQSKIDNVLKAICYCNEFGLIENQNGSSCVQDGTYVWCIFDRDIEEDIAKNQLGNTSFNESIKTALSNGLKVAWSNDSFELWILLHFEDVVLSDKRYKYRNTYYDRLTEIFKSLSEPNEYLVNALRHPTFNYKQDCKSEKNFRYIVRNEIIGKTKEAIARAKKLEEYHNSTNIQNHAKSPCTLVHHLIEELIRLGGKEI